ncbi:DUF4179 domain-containing protein [Desulfosporosinus sp. FKA]|uniref:DUF4179 domain-containing protein n=1 Tax=Desulfosporosinus sp. FKA TaxID=1969834 RepID=UPI000B49950F|nr:DUF4179 domain-containing protein [Desulfosporosinus sp. FKA]
MKDSFERNELRSKLEIPSVVPEYVNDRINETLQNLEPRKRNRRLTKKSLIILAACIVISSLSALAAFGQNLPIINSILKTINPAAAKSYETVKVDISDKQQGNTTNSIKRTVVNRKVTDKGITFTVNDLAFDGTTLIVGFSVSKPGGFGGFDIDPEGLFPFFQNPNVGSPLGRNFASTGDYYLLKKDMDDYQGYASFYFGKPETKLQDNYTLALGFGNLNILDGKSSTMVNGNWQIETGLTVHDIYTPAQITESNVMHKLKNGEVNSIKIIQSALNSSINLHGKYNIKDLQPGSPFKGFFILDNKGNCLNYKNIVYEDSYAGDGKFNTVINLLRIPSDTKKLTVIPYTSLYGKLESNKEKEYSADISKLPVTIKIQDQEIKISDVERGQGTFIMHYTISGLTESRAVANFWFEDKAGHKIEETGLTLRGTPMDYETGQGTYEFKTDRPQDVAKVIIPGHDYVLQNDYKFDVELK